MWTGNYVTLVRSNAITVKHWVIILTNVQSHKTSFDLGDLFIDNWTSKENNVALKQIPYIYYLIWFKKNKVQALIDLGSESTQWY